MHSRFPKRNALSSDLSSGDALRALSEACAALQKLAQVTLGKPASDTQTHTLSPSPTSGFTFNELANEFLVAKARSCRSDRYLRQMRTVFASFGKGRSRKEVDTITLHDIETWLDSGEWAARTIRGHLSSLRILFSWGERRGYCRSNPCDAVECPDAAGERIVEVHTPEQVLAVLEAARRQDLDVMRHLAVRYFAGVRSAEAHRLREMDLLPGFVSVPADKSKTRSRRLVAIKPALQAWLDLGGELRALSPNTVQAAARSAGVAWHHNVTRHSFVTYHLAAFESAGRTALEAGHSEAILFRHYRALATPAQGHAYWGIRPKAK